MSWEVIQGDCLDVMRSMPDNSVDSVVTDPPYGLEFMGVAWDTFGDGPKGKPRTRNEWGDFGSREHPRNATQQARIARKKSRAFEESSYLWAVEALRVLKPGGHLLAFGGTRTYHRMAVAIEDAGFEIRDSLMWIYGSGFPKSHDVSKAIDKRGGKNISWFGPWLREERNRRGITQKELAKHFPSKTGGMTGCVANWELGLNLPTVEQFNTLCEVLNLPFSRLSEAEREVIGKSRNGFGPNSGASLTHKMAAHPDITAPATPEAAQWQGWGTALKPSHEPIVMARKPLSEKSIAANVLVHGTGALNIESTRVGVNDNDPNLRRNGHMHVRNSHGGYSGGLHNPTDVRASKTHLQGRWPPNTLLDTHAAAALDAQSGVTKSKASGYNWQESNNDNPAHVIRNIKSGVHYEDQGGCSRFFPVFEPEYDVPFLYVAKASRRERNAGLEGLPEKPIRESGSEFGKMTMWNGENGDPEWRAKNPNKPTANVHPTVKPIRLMEWLVRLVTPPGGVCLDPFCGSGSTGVASVNQGFSFVGVEQDPEYAELSRQRIEYWANVGEDRLPKKDLPLIPHENGKNGKALQGSLWHGSDNSDTE